MFGISRWRHRDLLAAWATYWVALIAIKLGGAIRSVLAVTLPANGHGSFSASFGDKGMVVTVVNGASTVWTGTAPLSTIALWVAGPPLLVWVAWLVSRPRHPDVVGRDAESAPTAALAPGDANFARGARDDVVHERRDRP